MIVSLIAALNDSRVIGNKNRIPWHIREDLIRFKEKTLHHTVIMGRTTFESLMEYYKKSKRPLPERKTIIITKDPSYVVSYENCHVVTSIDGALEKAKEIEREEVFISGGASIFQQTIGRADRLYLTLVHKEVEGDTYFPEYGTFTKIIRKEDRLSSDGIAYTFIDLERGQKKVNSFA